MTDKRITRWSKDKIQGIGKTPREIVRERAPIYTDTDIAKYLNSVGFECTTMAVSHHRSRMGIKKHSFGTSEAGAVVGMISESPFVKYDSPPVIEADRVIVMPDIQAPYHHHEFVNHVLDVCDVLNVKTAIWAGDVLENSALTHFDPNWAQEGLVNGGVPDMLANELIDMGEMMGKKVTEGVRELLLKHGRRVENNPAGVSEEWAHARKVLQTMEKLFDKIEWQIGNHEGRILRQMQSPFFAEDLRRLFVSDKVHISPYYYCILKSGGVDWRVTHPKPSSKGDAKWIASRYLTNVIMAHNHQLVMQKDRSGKFWAIETGMMVDEMRLPYCAQRDTKGDMHSLGATLILEGQPILLYENSPWELLKRLK